MQRMGEVQDIGNTALYLAGPCADYISGWNILVDGGAYLTMPNLLFNFPAFTQRWAEAKL